MPIAAPQARLCSPPLPHPGSSGKQVHGWGQQRWGHLLPPAGLSSSTGSHKVTRGLWSTQSRLRPATPTKGPGTRGQEVDWGAVLFLARSLSPCRWYWIWGREPGGQGQPMGAGAARGAPAVRPPSTWVAAVLFPAACTPAPSCNLSPPGEVLAWYWVLGAGLASMGAYDAHCRRPSPAQFLQAKASHLSLPGLPPPTPCSPHC